LAVEVSFKGDVLEVVAVRPLFGPIVVIQTHAYDVSADGQHFLVRTAADLTNPVPLTFVQNWTATMKK
jgi:hypothetical protein